MATTHHGSTKRTEDSKRTVPRITFPQECKDKGETGEADFKAWLDRNGFGYVAICQATKTFARLFTGKVKRPDFLIVVDGMGLIAVDAKNREPFKTDKAVYTLPHDVEFKRAILFERMFRIPIWYAYRGQQPDEWLWINAIQANEVGVLRRNEKGSFLKIKVTDFVSISSGADFGRLYTQRLPGLDRLGADLQSSSGCS